MSEAPQKLGKYEVLRELGRGAMGVVYEAFDPSIERTVALKTIRRDQLEGDSAAEMITRFQREAKAAGRLNHPNIVAIYDFGEDGDTTFIAMEFVIGRELKSHFAQDERFPLDEITRIMGELLDALEYSHNFGVVHRDIKPANIIIRPNGQVKVADFGIARIESSQYTQAGSVLGTPAYMSPEQFMGQTVDRRSDLFSAGVVLYEFLTGERPFSGTATTIMHKVLSVDPPPPSRLNVQVPKPFDSVIAKAMAKRPEDRFKTAAEFADAIRLAAKGVAAPGLPEMTTADGTVINTVSDATLKEVPASAAAKTPAQLAPAPAPTAPPSAEPAPKRKAPMLAIAATVTVIIGAGIANYFVLQPGKSRDVACCRSRHACAHRGASDRGSTIDRAGNAGGRRVACGRTRHHDHQCRGTRRSAGPEIPGRQIAAHRRSARGLQEPKTGRKSHRAVPRPRIARQEL